MSDHRYSNVTLMERLKMLLERERKDNDILKEEVAYLRKALNYYAVGLSSEATRANREIRNLRNLRSMDAAELEGNDSDTATCPITYPNDVKAKKKKPARAVWEG